MKVYVLVDKDTYGFWGVAASLEKAEAKKTELLEIWPKENIEIEEKEI